MGIRYCSKVRKIIIFELSKFTYNSFFFYFLGDLQNEEAVLEWLVDDDNRELADEIEQVNNRMLERLLDESHFLAVFFCKFYFIFFVMKINF